jgi:hypothetical protein
MIQQLKGQELVNWARSQEPSQGIVHVLCDALQEAIDKAKPKSMSWEGVWGAFEERERRIGRK